MHSVSDFSSILSDPFALPPWGNGPAYVYNLSPATVPLSRSVLKSLSANVPVYLEGDSVPKGVDGNFPANPEANPAQYTTQSINELMAASLNGVGIPAGGQSFFGISGTLADYAKRTDRLVISGAGVVLGSNKYLGGTEIRFTAAGTATYNVSGVDTMLYVWADQTTTGRSFYYKADGGSTVVVSTTGVARQVVSAPVSLGSVGNHSVEFGFNAGTSLLCGAIFYNSTRPEISIRQIAISGGVSANFVDDAGAPQQGRVTAFSVVQAQAAVNGVLFTEMGSVNVARQAALGSTASVDAYKADMLNRIDASRAAGVDPIYVTQPYDNGTATGNVVNQQQYVDVGINACLVKGCPWIDTRAMMGGSYAASVALGYQAIGDNVHMTLAGKVLWANKFNEVLRWIRNS